MWTKPFLVFPSSRMSAAGHAFLAASANMQKSFWMTAEFLVSICCQTFVIASKEARLKKVREGIHAHAHTQSS